MSTPSITCPQCGMTSYNQNDIEQRYCGNCHQFHKDMQKPSPTFHFNPEIYPLLTWFKDSPDTGMPECLCSYCGKMIESSEDSDEPIPLRVFRESDNTELRLHWGCVGKVIVELGQASDSSAADRL